MTRAAGKISGLDTTGRYSLAARVCCGDLAASSMFDFDSKVVEFSLNREIGLSILPPPDSSVGAQFTQQLAERYGTEQGTGRPPC